MKKFIDYYQILGVDETASLDVIKGSYRELAKKHHPDNNGAKNQMQLVNEAYSILGKPDAKIVYDAMRLKHYGRNMSYPKVVVEDIESVKPTISKRKKRIGVLLNIKRNLYELYQKEKPKDAGDGNILFMFFPIIFPVYILKIMHVISHSIFSEKQ